MLFLAGVVPAWCNANDWVSCKVDFFLLVMNVIRIKIRVEKAHEVFKKNKMEKREDLN